MEYLTKNGLAVLCWGLIFLGVLFLLIGCGPIYKSLGFTDVEAEEQVAKDKAEIIDAIENGTVEPKVEGILIPIRVTATNWFSVSS